MDQAKEASIGEETARQILNYYGEVDDPSEIARLARISTALVAASGRPELPYHFAILRTDIVNALALPGGYVLVTRGLLDFVRDDDELAGVIAHEIVHVARKHGVSIYKQGMRSMFVNFLILLLTRSPEAVIASDMYQQNKTTLYGRKAEVEADRYAVDYMVGAGYDPQALLRFFNRMGRYEARRPNLFQDYFDTHPPHDERVQLVEDHFRELKLEAPPHIAYRIQARVLAQEDCAPSDKGENCYGLVVDGEKELMRFGAPAGFASPYDRARVVAAQLNSLFEHGIKLYDVAERAAGGAHALFIQNKRVVDVLPGDVPADSDSRKVAQKWQDGIRLFLWTDYVKEEI